MNQSCTLRCYNHPEVHNNELYTSWLTDALPDVMDGAVRAPSPEPTQQQQEEEEEEEEEEEGCAALPARFVILPGKEG